MNQNNDRGNSSFISVQTSSSEGQGRVTVGHEHFLRGRLNTEQLSSFLLALGRQSMGYQAGQTAVPIEQYERTHSDLVVANTENYLLRTANRELVGNNNILQNTNVALRSQISSLFRRNQELAEENSKLKSEREIWQERQEGQERSNNTMPVQTTRLSIFGAIDQIKQAKEKEKGNRPNCEVNNNEFVDKNDL